MTNITDSKSVSESHAIQVPQEFVRKLWLKFRNGSTLSIDSAVSWSEIVACAAQWGWDQREPELQERADQEVDACCEWLTDQGYGPTSERLRAARRPKPPTLAEQGMEALNKGCFPSNDEIATIRVALNRLKELENQQ